MGAFHKQQLGVVTGFHQPLMELYRNCSWHLIPGFVGVVTVDQAHHQIGIPPISR